MKNNFRELVQTLKKLNLTIGSVESMTGGLFGAKLTSIAGASAIYRGSLITYHKDLKTSLANVDPKLIDKYGVVSKEVAIAMAEGGSKVLGVDIAISITGNAGPTREKGEAPVGEMFVAIKYKNEIFTKKINIFGTRNVVRNAAASAMSSFVLEIIKK